MLLWGLFFWYAVVGGSYQMMVDNLDRLSYHEGDEN